MAGSQKITLWGPQRTHLGILRVNPRCLDNSWRDKRFCNKRQQAPRELKLLLISSHYDPKLMLYDGSPFPLAKNYIFIMHGRRNECCPTTDPVHLPEAAMLYMLWSRPFLLRRRKINTATRVKTAKATASPIYRATSVCTSARVAERNK